MRGVVTEFRCDWCGAEFLVEGLHVQVGELLPRGWLEHDEAQFCSRQCRDEYLQGAAAKGQP